MKRLAVHAAAGMRPSAFHVTNLLLHSGCVLLVALLVQVLRRRRAAPSSSGGLPAGRDWIAGAIFAGALAAVHPIHSEPVAAIYGRPDLLAAFLTLATLNLALRGRTAPALACLGLALLSKESTLGIPFLAPFALAEGERAGRSGLPSRLRAFLFVAVPGALLGCYLALREHAIGWIVDPRSYSVLDNPIVHAEGRERWLTPVAVVGRYAALWIWPSSLCADRGFDTVPLVSSLTDPLFLAGASTLILGSIALVALAFSRSIWALPLAAAGLAFLPASNLLVLSPTLMAERFTYLPSLLICALLGLYAHLTAPSPPSTIGGGAFGDRPMKRLAVHAAATLVLLLPAARTHARAEDFADDLSLYGSSVRSCPQSAKSRYNYGNALAGAGRETEAIESFKAAVSIAPWLAIAHNNLGNSYLHLGRFQEAEGAFREACEISPRLLNPHESLAGLLFQDGRLKESLVEAGIALSLNPDPSDAAQLEELISRVQQRLGPGP